MTVAILIVMVAFLQVWTNPPVEFWLDNSRSGQQTYIGGGGSTSSYPLLLAWNTMSGSDPLERLFYFCSGRPHASVVGWQRVAPTLEAKAWWRSAVEFALGNDGSRSLRPRWQSGHRARENMKRGKRRVDGVRDHRAGCSLAAAMECVIWEWRLFCYKYM